MAAIARQADVSRTFLCEHTEARKIIADATVRARGLRVETDQARRDRVEACWRERALNAEEALKNTNAEVANQRRRIAELLG